MKREPLVYTVLVVAALALAFRTWTHQDRSTPAPGTVEPWHESADAFVALEYTRPDRRVEIRRQSAGDTTFLWATADTAGFLVDADGGKRLLDALATPQALRDLGIPNARERQAYGLDTARTRLVVRFRDGSRDLLVGAAVYLSGDRYVLERRGGHVFVVPADALVPLDDPAPSLMQHRMHAFTPEQVAAVTVRDARHPVAMRRHASAPAAPGASPPPAGWVPATGPQRPDAVFATFMQRLDALWAASYAPRVDPRTLTSIMRVEYADARGRPLGFLELFRAPGQAPAPSAGSAPGQPPAPEFYVRTELTRTLVRLFPGAGDNLAADVAQGL